MSGLSEFLPPDAWTALKEAHKEAWLNYGSFYARRWANDGSLSPLDVYCYLRARFGVPNGPTMAHRHWSTENIYQWHYVAACRDRVIHFISRVDRLEIVPQIDSEASSDQWRGFVQALKADFGRIGADLGKVRKSLETWDLFVNPFCRLSGIIERLERTLAGRKMPPLPNVPDLAGDAEIEKVAEELKAFVDQGAELKAAGLAVRMLVPVWGESFVNLILFVLGKPDLKRDERVCKSVLRQDIDVRVASLHLHCQGFAKPVKRESDPFKQFHTLMNSRNELLHGNVDPSVLEFGQVSFDRVRYAQDGPEHQIPIFRDEQNLAYRLLEGCSRDISPDKALGDIGVVRGFVQFVLERLEPQARSSMEMVMASEHLGWLRGGERVGVLFPNAIPLGMIGGKASS